VTRTFPISALLGVLIVAALIVIPPSLDGGGRAEAVPGVPDPVSGWVDNILIDMDPYGVPANPANGLLGSIETCKAVPIGGSIDIDIVVDEVDPSDLIKGFGVNHISYTGAGAGAISITGVNTNLMIGANAGSNPVGLNDRTPDADGMYSTNAIDVSGAASAMESGEGVLSRLTITGVGPAGVSAINLPATIGDSAIVTFNSGTIIPNNLSNAVVVVGDYNGDTVVDDADCDIPDSDGDGEIDPLDNCPSDPNPNQADVDDDDIGDACDSCPGDAANDFDDDGICAGSGFQPPKTGDSDNCASISNPNQINRDGDPYGDACDNCISTSNPDQANADGDAYGDACDNCPLTSTPWFVPPGDSDCDGFSDSQEAFVGTDPADACPDNEDDDAWPSDLATIDGYGKHDGKSDIFDLNELTPPYFAKCDPDPLYTVRKDFSGLTEYVPDGCIKIFDIALLTPPMFGQSCTP
jgi:hypothetical protein